MPSDYAAATGGALKLKGANVTKTKKKKKKPTIEQSTSSAPTTSESTTVATRDASQEDFTTPKRSVSPETAERELKAAGGRQKTEAEKRYEERRRKRLEERLKKEGVKTHKEKVEELNKYLSGLSEHHDMPKIGPG
ncbi:DUF1754-domain-containing protein [Sporormia fimetaria CBS 119925]|uniref:DUF1754-domain-containing protein n=1 Tax=Sporormia fimetaria CBS 119925 TaxID=1340428 RepID=A0A6A6V6X5_9PLEO|nr:DUF1754-domain-containing protein [Sporormia fimetaria CBS 119925]